MADANEKLKTEFNQWAAEGRGEEMERHHLSIATQTIARMALKPGDRVLDLGCGAGWATRLLAQAVEGGMGMAVGLDISDEMIARARAASVSVENVLFSIGCAEEIPWRDEYFESVLSIESFYYYPDQEAVLRELYRVLVLGGRLFILINLYRENPYSLGWVKELKVPVHVRSEIEYREMLGARGFVDVEIARIPDLTPTPERGTGNSTSDSPGNNTGNNPGGSLANGFANADELREFKRIGALLLVARRPKT
jgi:SAM-dependent methyltransferase